MADLLYDVIRVSATKAEFTGSKLKNGMFGWATDTNEFVAKDAGTYYFFKNFDDIETLLDGKEDTLGFTPEDEANKENTTIDTSTTKYPTVNLLKAGLDGIAYPYEDVREPTGFKDPINVNLSYSTIDRKVTITGNPTAYYQGTDISDLFVGFESEAHALGNNEYWLQYNGTAFEWTLTPDFKALLIALVYVHNGTICNRECHGFMHWETHSNLHNTVGCFLRSGGDISGYTLASTTEADRRPEISQTTVVDEDLPTVNALLSNTGAQAVYTQLYLDGADSTYIDVDNLDIVPLDGNTPYYNNFNTSTEEWEQVLMATNNSYQKIFVMATPASGGDVCQKGRYIFIQGQEVSTNLLTIQAITPADINLGLFNTGVSEFVYIGEIIIKYTTGGGGNWTITEVNKIRGTQSTQIKQATGNYLSSVATDGSIEGNGTIESPLSITDNITGTGTSGKLAKFTDGGVIGDSIVSESGTELTVGGDATIERVHLNADLWLQNGRSEPYPSTGNCHIYRQSEDLGVGSVRDGDMVFQSRTTVNRGFAWYTGDTTPLLSMQLNKDRLRCYQDLEVDNDLTVGGLSAFNNELVISKAGTGKGDGDVALRLRNPAGSTTPNLPIKIQFHVQGVTRRELGYYYERDAFNFDTNLEVEDDLTVGGLSAFENELVITKAGTGTGDGDVALRLRNPFNSGEERNLPIQIQFHVQGTVRRELGYYRARNALNWSANLEVDDDLTVGGTISGSHIVDKSLMDLEENVSLTPTKGNTIYVSSALTTTRIISLIENTAQSEGMIIQIHRVAGTLRIDYKNPNGTSKFVEQGGPVYFTWTFVRLGDGWYIQSQQSEP